MKKLWMAVIGLALLVGVVALAGCSTEGALSGGTVKVDLDSQQNGIWVTGEGKVTAIPDIATIVVGIEAQEATVVAAQESAALAMEQVMQVLDAQGIDDKDIQTQYYSIRAVTRWDSDTQQEITLGYRVTNSVTVKIRDIENTGAVIDAVCSAGGDLTRINSISFSIDDPSPYYEEAREKAVEDALAKAEKLADVADVKLGKPTYISESSYYPGPIYRGDLIGVAESSSSYETPISPGETELTITVQIAYDIVE